MQCSNVPSGIEQLHGEFAAREVPFSHSVVAADLADIEKHLVAELPVSLRCKECLSVFLSFAADGDPSASGL